MTQSYLEPTQNNGAALFRRNLEGDVIMLNLLRFREVADYSATPELAPDEPISGHAAYQLYMRHTLPFLTASGGSSMLTAEGGHWLIGPEDEQWDMVLLIQHHSVEGFMGFASDEAYLAGLGHRTAALADSRLLPLKSLG